MTVRKRLGGAAGGLILTLLVASSAQAELPLSFYAYDDAPAPCVETTCFFPAMAYPPVVNNYGEVAFTAGLPCSHCNCHTVLRSSSAWVVGQEGTYLVAASDDIVGEPPCPLISLQAPSTGTYDHEVLHFSDRGDVFFAYSEDHPRALWMVERDCREDSECASGMCDDSGACLCGTDDDCPSGRCVESACELRSGPVYYTGQPGPAGGTYFFSNLDVIRVNAHGVVVFTTWVQFDGYALPALIRRRPGEEPERIAMRDDVAPGAEGRTFFNFGTFAVADDPNGTVAFTAEVEGSWAPAGVWSDRSGVLEVVVMDNLETPSPAGAVEGVDTGVVAIDDDYHVFFQSFYDSAAPENPVGVFRAPPGVGGTTMIAPFTQLSGAEHTGGNHLASFPGGQAAYVGLIKVGEVSVARVMAAGQEVARVGQTGPFGEGREQWVYGSFYALVTNRAGQLSFMAELEPPCAGLDQATCGQTSGCEWSGDCRVADEGGARALFLWDPLEGLRLVVATGSRVAVAPGRSAIVTDIDLAAGRWRLNNPRTRYLNDAGKVCARLTLEGPGLSFGVACTRDPPTVRLVGLEVTQSIQDWQNSVPLVAGKLTYVRAHVESVEGARMEAVLHGYDADTGAELPSSPLRPLNPGGYVFAPADAQQVRARLGRSFYFGLDHDEWVSGRVRLKVELTNKDEVTLDCQEAAPPEVNDCEAEVTYEQGGVPDLVFHRVWYEDAHGVKSISDATLREMAWQLAAMYPVPDVNVTFASLPWPPATANPIFELPPDAKLANLILWAIRLSDGCGVDCHRVDFGAMPEAPKKTKSGGGWKLLGGWALGASDPTKPYSGKVAVGFRQPSGYARSTHTHEIGHCLGQQHLGHHTYGLDGEYRRGPCGAWGRRAEDYPYVNEVNGLPRSTLGPVDGDPNLQVFGFDAQQVRAIDPKKHFALMSYCKPEERWISRLTWPALRDVITTRFPPTPPGPPPPPPSPPQELLLLRGSIDTLMGSADILPLASVTIADAGGSTGEYVARLHDATDAVLAEVSFDGLAGDLFEMVDGVEDPSEFLEQLAFVVPLPLLPDARRLSISHGATLLGERVASATPPTVTILAPNGGEVLADETVAVEWEGSDPDGDELWYRLRYSPDNGVTWQTLALDWRDTRFTVPQRLLAGSENGLFEVQVSDGFFLAADTNDAPFTVPNQGPQVSVRQPGPGRLFVGHQPIALDAWVDDLEDGAVADTNVIWSSDVDGQLQVGRRGSLDASTLTEGEHQLTVQATDAQGATGEATVGLQVLREAPLDLADLLVRLETEPPEVAVGQRFAWTVEVQNQGPEQATGVSVTVTLPEGAHAEEPTAGESLCVVTGETVTCDRETLELDETWTIAIGMRPSELGSLEAAASVTAESTDPDLANNEASREVEVVEASDAPDGGTEDDGGGGGCGCRSVGSSGWGRAVALDDDAAWRGRGTRAPRPAGWPGSLGGLPVLLLPLLVLLLRQRRSRPRLGGCVRRGAGAAREDASGRR